MRSILAIVLFSIVTNAKAQECNWWKEALQSSSSIVIKYVNKPGPKVLYICTQRFRDEAMKEWYQIRMVGMSNSLSELYTNVCSRNGLELRIVDVEY